MPRTSSPRPPRVDSGGAGVALHPLLVRRIHGSDEPLDGLRVLRRPPERFTDLVGWQNQQVDLRFRGPQQPPPPAATRNPGIGVYGFRCIRLLVF
eukprot:3841183-Pyramimonas_sp.AAC.1